MTSAVVNLWGSQIGAVIWDTRRELGVFSYTPEFVKSGIQLAPFEMPLREGPFDFPAIPRETFKGLPGMLTDSLPDKFGDALINRWLTEQGRNRGEFNSVERLCYVGRRGMGALEFEPETEPQTTTKSLDLEPLVELANRVLAERGNPNGILQGDDDQQAMRDILKVGTSAGGARAKALIAWNPSTGEFRSGQLEAGSSFSYWLMKFDGVSGNSDKEVADPLGYGRLEYACHLLAVAAGITMSECRLHEEGSRAHFMTRRFDRTETGDKQHMQSLCSLRHFDFNSARAFSYEQAIETIQRLNLDRSAQKEMVRRAILNVTIRNQDDHTKNIAFLMNKMGVWSLAPAFDVVYAYNPQGDWTNEHQMSLNGKTDNFSMDDLFAFGAFTDLKKHEVRRIVDEINESTEQWPRFCEIAGVPKDMAMTAAAGFRKFK